MSRRIGNPDSKYTYCPGKLDKDIADKADEHQVFKCTVKQLILMDPSKMDLRYKDTIDALRELKEEYNL